MWGQAFLKKDYNLVGGIIPTDKFGTTCIYTAGIGSSPRVWGQGFFLTVLLFEQGIIPTRVGTSVCLHRGSVYTQDHPHACGDKSKRVSLILVRSGSSPRVWGQVQTNGGYVQLWRIIPTRVGTRLKKSRKIAVLQNQPLRFPLTFHRSFV